MPPSFLVTQAFAGMRLDKALHEHFPKLSSRERKALWKTHHIYLQGRKAQAGAPVQAGDSITLIPKDLENSAQPQLSPKSHATFITRHEDWLFFNKPCGLHSAHISGGKPSFELWLTQQENKYGKLFLCNRLDAQTSGILVTARSQAAALTWQDMEDKGLCQKRYVALVQGHPKKICIRAQLDTDKRKVTKVLTENAPQLRHTDFSPIRHLSPAEYQALCAYFPSFPKQQPQELSLMGCCIHKGARHQIRAHAAHAGFALFNDIRYTQKKVSENESFLLHHGSLLLPHAHIICPAIWEDALQETEKLRQFFMDEF